MNCFNCGSVLSETDYCNSCGVDVKIYKKIIKLSNRYYNIGLLKAQNRDLSGAAEVLKRSIRLDKKNTDARNLLGLVYFEMGEVVQALAEWVISKNFQPEKNLADDYIRTIQSNPGKFDTINQSIKKFNMALSYADQGSDDLAIIQLKKVLAMNSNLVKGYQLITLLYIRTEEYDKARKMIQKALKVDTCNPVSLRYLKEIESKRPVREEPVEKKEAKVQREPAGDTNREYLSGYDVIIPASTYKEPSSGAMTVINVIIGILIGAAAVYFLVTPAKVESAKTSFNQRISNYSEKITKLEGDKTDLNNQIETLKQEKENILNAGESKITVDDYENLLGAYTLYQQRKYVQSAKKLAQISTAKEASEAFKSIYQEVEKNAYGKAAEAASEEASEAFNGGDYNKAVKKYKEAFSYDKKSDTSLYMIARSYQELNDTANAEKYYRQVIAEFPRTDHASQALEALKQMGVDTSGLGGTGNE